MEKNRIVSNEKYLSNLEYMVETLKDNNYEKFISTIIQFREDYEGVLRKDRCIRFECAQLISVLDQIVLNTIRSNIYEKEKEKQYLDFIKPDLIEQIDYLYRYLKENQLRIDDFTSRLRKRILDNRLKLSIAIIILLISSTIIALNFQQIWIYFSDEITYSPPQIIRFIKLDDISLNIYYTNNVKSGGEFIIDLNSYPEKYKTDSIKVSMSRINTEDYFIGFEKANAVITKDHYQTIRLPFTLFLSQSTPSKFRCNVELKIKDKKDNQPINVEINFIKKPIINVIITFLSLLVIVIQLISTIKTITQT